MHSYIFHQWEVEQSNCDINLSGAHARVSLTVPSWLAAVIPQRYSSTTSTMPMEGCTVTVPKVTYCLLLQRRPNPHPHPHPSICNLSDLVQVHMAHYPAVLPRSLSRGASCVCNESAATRGMQGVWKQIHRHRRRARGHANTSMYKSRVSAAVIACRKLHQLSELITWSESGLWFKLLR